MKGEGLETKMFCIGQDKITYLTWTIKVKITVTSFYIRHCHALIYTHTKYERSAPETIVSTDNRRHFETSVTPQTLMWRHKNYYIISPLPKF